MKRTPALAPPELGAGGGSPGFVAFIVRFGINRCDRKTADRTLGKAISFIQKHPRRFPSFILRPQSSALIHEHPLVGMLNCGYPFIEDDRMLTTKQRVATLLQELPDECSIEDIY